MLTFLQGLRFYNDGDVRARLRDLHDFVRRDLAASGHEVRTGGNRYRSDIVVCSLDGGGSGASALVKPYRDENRIYAARAVDAPQVPAVVNDPSNGVRAVVILEDFIGTARPRHVSWRSSTANGAKPG